MSQLQQQIAENLARVRERMAAAAGRAGRAAEDVQLVAVTKYVDLPEVEALVAAGCRVLGESRPQELWRKAEACAGLDIEWHLVGHLQRNKVRRTLPLCTWIHSADSLRLLRALDAAAAELDRRPTVLLEVNVSGEVAKHGFAPEEVEPLLPQLAELEHLEIRGLMTMAALAGGANEARRDFAALRALRDKLRSSCPGSIRLDELSMGMSRDFEIAIEEGATIVRVGSALYEGLG